MVNRKGDVAGILAEQAPVLNVQASENWTREVRPEDTYTVVQWVVFEAAGLDMLTLVRIPVVGEPVFDWDAIERAAADHEKRKPQRPNFPRAFDLLPKLLLLCRENVRKPPIGDLLVARLRAAAADRPWPTLEEEAAGEIERLTEISRIDRGFGE
jgi:hypothetical protein